MIGPEKFASSWRSRVLWKDGGQGDGPGGDSGGSSGGSGTGSDSNAQDGTSAPSGFGGADRNSDPANDKGPDAPSSPTSAPGGTDDARSFFSYEGPMTVDPDPPAYEGPETLHDPAKPGLLNALVSYAQDRMTPANLAMSGFLSAMPGVNVLSTLTDIARAIGLDEEPAGDPGEGDPDGSSGGPQASFYGPPASFSTVTVNPPVFSTVGAAGLPAAAASFTTPQGTVLDSGTQDAAPAAGEGQEPAPIWPAIAAAALLALAA